MGMECPKGKSKKLVFSDKTQLHMVIYIASCFLQISAVIRFVSRFVVFDEFVFLFFCWGAREGVEICAFQNIKFW